MTQIELRIPKAASRGFSDINAAMERSFEELHGWFRDMGVCIHRLEYKEIPLSGFQAAYNVTVEDGVFLVRVYVEDPNIAMLAKLRFGGELV